MAEKKQLESRKRGERQRNGHHRDPWPILLADESQESSTAAIKLALADLPYNLVPNETRGIALYTSRVTYCGPEGIDRYIAEKTAEK